jgi:hypothetical protein
MDFIFMLTRGDQTIPDCLQVVDRVANLGIRHIGFKDVGVDTSVLRELNACIRGSGAVSYLEVVSTSRERALESAEFAVEIGVDRLLGGTWIEDTLDRTSGSAVEYFPFVGRPEGHPTRLGGSPQSVAADVARAAELGCGGVDLLAYRAYEADPLELVRAARQAFGGQLVAAGNVATTSQITDLWNAGVDAFTIGSAAFAGALDERSGTLEAQLRPVIDVLQQLAA